MQRFFDSVLSPLMDMLRPARIVEIGAAWGTNSNRLAAWCKEHHAYLDVIDTAPRFDAEAFERDFAGVAAVHVGLSLDVLPRLPAPDLALIDGDHNWYTVFHELQALAEAAIRDGKPFPVCVLHDTAWPYARRDLYYDPSTIPASYRQVYRRGPLARGHSGIVEYGLNPHVCHAQNEGGPRNGVLTALEDFCSGQESGMVSVHLPVLFGLSILAGARTLTEIPGLRGFLDGMRLSEPWRSLVEIAEAERCDGCAATHRLLPLPQPPDAPAALPVSARSFSPYLPAEILASIQEGVLKYRYRDRALYKSPFDLALYLRLLGRLRPRTVLEVGMADGGSALWFADMLTVLGVDGRVVTVDRQPRQPLEDHRITVLTGEATDLGAVLPLEFLATMPKPWLVVEDSEHTFDVCGKVLTFFDTHLSPGDYIVIEDGNVRGLPGEHYRKYLDGPSRAIEAFLADRGADYEIDTDSCDYFGFNVTYNPNGWLRRR